jgi:hypothetical protein
MPGSETITLLEIGVHETKAVVCIATGAISGLFLGEERGVENEKRRRGKKGREGRKKVEKAHDAHPLEIGVH